VEAHLNGSWTQLRGAARLRAERIAPLPGRFTFPWPAVTALDLRLTGDRDGLELADSSVTIEGQLVRASGSLPVAAVRWEEFVREPKLLAQRGAFRIEVPDADLAAVARFFPGYLAAKGRVHVVADFQPATGLTGSLQLHDAMSRPLGPLGVLQDINAEVSFAGRTLHLTEVTARMGGQLVTLRGQAEVPATEHDVPKMEITLQGENLPFVRQMGLLLRGDLDLKLTADDVQRPRITGDVRLRDSLFLSDVRSLIPSGAKPSDVQAPYFAISQPPFNDWLVDVSIAGNRFMRLSTTVFSGTASARFHLIGTLGHPVAIGEAAVEEGTVRLPFASFDVKQGQVRLTREQPTEPQLWIAGTGRRYGYDLRLEISGPLSSPNMTFTSSPPLDAEQVVLMVMAGQAPHNEIATTDRQRATRFGAYFGQSLLGSLGGGASEGADRLTISSGENVSQEGHETYDIEYKLTDRWSLTGEYDEFDEYYGGLKWRVYPKKEKGDRETK
jgi:translocation and assembly module TamB